MVVRADGLAEVPEADPRSFRSIYATDAKFRDGWLLLNAVQLFTSTNGFQPRLGRPKRDLNLCLPVVLKSN